MNDKPTNPLDKLKDVELSKDDQMKMLKNLQDIMEAEEAGINQGKSRRHAAPGSHKHRKSGTVPTWVKTASAGIAAVIVVGGVLLGVEQHLKSTTTASHNQPPKVGQNLPGQDNSQTPPPNSNQAGQVPPANDNSANSVTNQNVPGKAGSPLAKLNPGQLNAASYVNSEVGFIAGKDGIYKTEDGGQTWTKVYSSSSPILGLSTDSEQVQGTTMIWAVAWTKSQMIGSYQNGDKWTPVKVNLPNMGSIQDVTQLPNAQIAFIMNGSVYASDAMGSGWHKQTPPESVVALSSTDMNTWYAAASSGSVYKTTDGGVTWKKVFTASIATSSHWQAEVQAIGNNVAVYYYGGDAAMSQQAYVMYESTDAGANWNALFDEAYFPAYGNTQPLTRTQFSLQPGPYALLSNGNIVYAGTNPQQNNVTTLYVITPTGSQVTSSVVRPSPNASNVFGLSEMPFAVASPDGQRILVVGVDSNHKGVAELSQDGGQTWQSP